MAGTQDLQGPSPMFPFALPGPAIEIEPTLVLGAVFMPITVPPTVISGVMLGTTEGPHVVKGPNDRLANAADDGQSGMVASCKPMSS